MMYYSSISITPGGVHQCAGLRAGAAGRGERARVGERGPHQPARADAQEYMHANQTSEYSE